MHYKYYYYCRCITSIIIGVFTRNHLPSSKKLLNTLKTFISALYIYAGCSLLWVVFLSFRKHRFRFLTEGNYLESTGLELGRTFLLQTHRLAQGKRLTDLIITIIIIIITCYLSTPFFNCEQFSQGASRVIITNLSTPIPFDTTSSTRC